MSDEENVWRPRRGRRPALVAESSDSESDSNMDLVGKRKKMNVIESDSSSDSSASSVLGGRLSRPMKKRARVASDNDSSSSEESSDDSNEESSSEESEEIESDVSTHRSTRRRVRGGGNVPASSSAQSDSEGFSSESDPGSVVSYESYNDTDDEAMIQAAIQESLASMAKNSESVKETSAKEKALMPESTGFASDSSDGQSEKCPICLLSFTNQEIGSPETCDHTFCSLCIQEWAKNVNTCPVDRQTFSLILVRKELNGNVIKKIPITSREARDPQESDSDPTICEVCRRSDREDRLLLCDGCDLGYHLECLNPPLENVPIEEWFCPECAGDNSSGLAEEVEMQEDELFDLLDDIVQIRPRTSRLLPRTRQSERVRASLRSRRQELLQQNPEPALQVLYDNGNLEVGISYWSDSD